MGDRSAELAQAVASIRAATPDEPADIVVVFNGTQPDEVPGTRSVHLTSNLGVPGGRHHAMSVTEADLVYFLDDDARVEGAWPARVTEQFATDERLAVVTVRIIDEQADTSRRHVPRLGRRGLERRGPVPTFLGGASVIRRRAYDAAGGYWPELFYGHEELDLAWRLHDRGWVVRYEPDALVCHPLTDISRHPRGWWHTGRNRVWVARRDLPWPIALLHTSIWLALGVWRAPSGECRRTYVAGWRSGWRTSGWGRAQRHPISWTTVWRLTRLGRPPIV